MMTKPKQTSGKKHHNTHTKEIKLRKMRKLYIDDEERNSNLQANYAICTTRGNGTNARGLRTGRSIRIGKSVKLEDMKDNSQCQ